MNADCREQYLPSYLLSRANEVQAFPMLCLRCHVVDMLVSSKQPLLNLSRLRIISPRNNLDNLVTTSSKIKRFVGTTENAVQSQSYVAIITYLLVAFLKFKSKIGWSTQEMLQLIQLNVFKRTDIEYF